MRDNTDVTIPHDSENHVMVARAAALTSLVIQRGGSLRMDAEMIARCHVRGWTAKQLDAAINEGVRRGQLRLVTFGPNVIIQKVKGVTGVGAGAESTSE